jgi:CRP/FNR family cyclic AMP-dependent transcriptional regulator
VFSNAKEVRRVAAGGTIFEAGDSGTEMYGIEEGEVELQGGHGVIAKLTTDDVFGEMALVDASPRMATAVATTDTQLAVIDRRLFLFLIHETPTFALQVMSAMADRLRSQG